MVILLRPLVGADLSAGIGISADPLSANEFTLTIINWNDVQV